MVKGMEERWISSGVIILKGNNWERIVHTFPPIYDSNTKVLLLGTAPSVKSRENKFYYGHPQNRFWRVLAQVVEDKLPETIDEKIAFLRKHGIGIYDVIESCDIIGSSDTSIKNVTPVDLAPILEITGRIPIFGNGATAAQLYGKHLESATGISITKLPSTSPANAAWRLEKLVSVWSEAILSYLD